MTVPRDTGGPDGPDVARFILIGALVALANKRA